MKKNIICLLLLSFCFLNLETFAMSKQESIEAEVIDDRVQPETPSNAPKWTDYVPEKYQNPRTDFTRGKAIGELATGIGLTDLIVTSPIGIPMICHATTKLRNISYATKKEKYFEGLKKAETMSEEEQPAYYNQLLKQCKMTEKQKKKLAKKRKSAEKKKAKKNKKKK